jgi:hypothetical protein
MIFFHQPHLYPKDKIVLFVFFVGLKLKREFHYQFQFISAHFLRVVVGLRQLPVDDMLQKDRWD